MYLKRKMTTALICLIQTIRHWNGSLAGQKSAITCAMQISSKIL